MPDLLLALLAGLAGGAYGAAIGGNWAFVVVAILAPVCWTISAVTGSPVPLDAVAFGPFFGPHVAFAGGAAGTIYAARHGLIPSGRLVNLSLGPLRNPRVLLVGAAFGALGVLVAAGVRLIPWFGSHTDAVAVTVTLSAFAARFAFGDKTFVNRAHFNTATSWPRVIAPTAEHCWLPRQEQPRHFLLLGALVGGIAGVVTLVLAALAPDAAGSANVVMFGVSGWAIIALQLGHPGWVTHHISNSAGLTALLVLPRIAGIPEPFVALSQPSVWPLWWASTSLAVVAAAAGGVLAAAAAELGARLFLNRSDSFIDPPALAIWPCVTLLSGLLR